MTEISETVAEYNKVNQQIKQLKDQKDDLRTEILTHMKIADQTEFEDDDFSVAYSMSKRKSFNKEEAITFIQDKGGDANAFFTESEFETLKVKAKGGE